MKCLEKDCKNYIEKVRRLRLGEGDATAVQNYFVSMQAQNANFFYAIDLDKNGRLRNVFWADARSRAAYEEFGDVVTFDTTYLTNKYDMPFAPFVGVNHHGQSILLGCGLISREDTDSFIWLFKTWLACMSGHAPCGIITDQDKAMKKAIEVVFPNTRHRLCLWHIMKKVPDKLKSYKEYESMSSSLGNIVYDSMTSEDFEERWVEMIGKYKFKKQARKWLRSLYAERHHWVPVYVKNKFWAGMSTTQRSESMNAFFDGHVNSKTTLKQFVEQYENALRSKVLKEASADSDSFSSNVRCATHYDMEKQVQAVYTISKFKEFQKELTSIMYCDRVSVETDNAILEYQIAERMLIKEKKKKTVIFKVQFNESEIEVNCNCCKFEFRGILCRHVLYVLVNRDIDFIPDKYIIRRWRKDVKRCHTRVRISYCNWVGTPEAQRPDKMQKTFDDIKELANDSDDKCMLVVRWMHKLKEQICKHDRAARSTQPTPQSPNDMNSDPLSNPSQRILTPLSARGKSRPPSKRKQSKSEQVIKRRKKKITSCKDNTEEEGTQKSIESDAICHIDGPPPCRSDNIVATQESNVVVEHSHLTQGVQVCMLANQYPIFPHTNENMALLLGLSQGSHPNPSYKESEIGNISYPTMHGNYVQGQQYPYWNGGYSMYNMHSSTSRGNDDQELN
ncbi:protein FAR1-RELATED SEQUENCE 5-like [Malus domestica]|uniref:protein FAR1-RELATED SEQUENCE 5-like n=1 Tax=Malus domestica TaxID=3750 RepID=UPI003975E56F